MSINKVLLEAIEVESKVLNVESRTASMIIRWFEQLSDGDTELSNKDDTSRKVESILQSMKEIS